MARKFLYCSYEGNKYKIVTLTTTLMLSLLTQCKTKRHVILSKSFNPSALWLNWNTTNCNFVHRTMNHQTPSMKFCYINQSNNNLFHQKNIESMQQKEQFRLLRITSSEVHAQQTPISLCKYLSNSFLRLKTPSTCSDYMWWPIQISL